ncbi:hypothetical protein GCM10009836_64700 [Pseudonocardia ailaonensis]|uniref:HTH tetR-type domain-containing protein n=1 Tax=Pseudonocardia ailaonensis TaxID=367279 RepID=A0ABN2NMA1_9PSEU
MSGEDRSSGAVRGVAPAADPGGGRAAPGQPARRVRADARRNAERIVRVALAGLEEGPGDGSGSGAGNGTGRLRLHEVATRAGVGVATLYRLFESREGLVRAAWATFVDEELTPLAEAAVVEIGGDPGEVRPFALPSDAAGPRTTGPAGGAERAGGTDRAPGQDGDPGGRGPDGIAAAALRRALGRSLDALAAHQGLLAAARETSAIRVESVFGYLAALREVLGAAQREGGVRADLTVRDLGAVLIMALATVHPADPAGDDRRRALRLLLDGMRPGTGPLPPPSPGALLKPDADHPDA